MSPVFRHGRLRLYLLKLLDEAPRHGYEVIRLLQDRFLGVYAPSPGTIYPRLARLEEEGLVTHDEVDGKKVYRITDAGREEIRARLDDLAELEEEITESVRDIAREVTQDVRDTVRNLREELTWAARDVRKEGREQAREQARERARQARDAVKDSARQARAQARGAEQQAEPAGDAGAWEAAAQPPEAGAPAGTREWPDWAAFQDWQSWAGWRERPGKRGWPGLGGFPGQAPGPAGRGSWPKPGRGGPGRPDAGLFRDLERLAVDFARELRSAAWHTESVGENALGDLRAILEETLSKVRDEVFGGTAAGSARGAQSAGTDDGAETAGPDGTRAETPGPAGTSAAETSGPAGTGAETTGPGRTRAEDAGPADEEGSGPGS